MALEVFGDAPPTSLEGKLVEIGQVSAIEPDGAYPGSGPVEISGSHGRVIGFAAEQNKYIVHLFNGLVVYVEAEKISLYEQPEADEDNGFDVAWPDITGNPEQDSITVDAFSETVGKKIIENGFCVIQMFEGPDHSREVVETCNEALTWGCLDYDVEDDFLGADPAEGKVAWLQYEAPMDRTKLPGMRTCSIEQMGASLNMEGLTALERADRSLTALAAMLWSRTQAFGQEKAFITWGRTNPLVRSGIESTDNKQQIQRNTYGMNDDHDLDEFVNFVDSKRLCVLYIAEAEGGEIVFEPYPEAYELNMATIPLQGNKIIIFRCDGLGLSYSYKPTGRNLCLQTWVLDPPPSMREQEEELRDISGPEEPEGRRNNVMSIATRFPGESLDPIKYVNFLEAGGDGQLVVPTTRWDIDIYYRAEHTVGYSMTCHGSMISDKDLSTFDNQFFGIPQQEAITMAPYMRILLEVGYEAMARAGHKRADMNGWHCGVFVGDSGSDWESFLGGCINQDNYGYMFAGIQRSAAANRLSHVFGLRGPISTAETACSSSLVACGVAAMTMRQRVDDQKASSVQTSLKHAVTMGANTLIGPGGYIMLSGPGMLTQRGRCFTFDNSADGFARGEGLGAIQLKVCENAYESQDRVAMLIGCAVNQDGRSASMTAPHGPSQQLVIKASMDEAGLSAKNITIAECHGTGTALGDPIEVGALRGVMGNNRERPFLKTSSKSNLGHLEAGAGIAGLIKCICMLNYATAMPNLHLLTLNPHLDVAGFPVYFETEAMDFGYNSGLTGVSSFGFGGTNARADVWGHAQGGPRACVTGNTLKPIMISV